MLFCSLTHSLAQNLTNFCCVRKFETQRHFAAATAVWSSVLIRYYHRLLLLLLLIIANFVFHYEEEDATRPSKDNLSSGTRCEATIAKRISTILNGRERSLMSDRRSVGCALSQNRDRLTTVCANLLSGQRRWIFIRKIEIFLMLMEIDNWFSNDCWYWLESEIDPNFKVTFKR